MSLSFPAILDETENLPLVDECRFPRMVKVPAIFHGLVNWHGTSAGTDDQFMVEYRPKVFDKKETKLAQIPKSVGLYISATSSKLT